jgi:hypothetical protein
MIFTKICALSRRALAVEVQDWVSRWSDSARGRTGITGKWKSKEFAKICEVRTMATNQHIEKTPAFQRAGVYVILDAQEGKINTMSGYILQWVV